MKKESILTIFGACLITLLVLTSCSTNGSSVLPASSSPTTAPPVSPTQMVLATQYGTHFIGYTLDSPTSASIENVASSLGKPLSSSEITEIQQNGDSSSDGITLDAYYSQPISLRSTDGTLLANVKYIAIQWDRSDGQPNRLLYSTDCDGLFGAGFIYYPLVIEGGFQIAGSVTTLEQAE
jgi:hypothetical protein